MQNGNFWKIEPIFWRVNDRPMYRNRTVMSELAWGNDLTIKQILIRYPFWLKNRVIALLNQFHV